MSAPNASRGPRSFVDNVRMLLRNGYFWAGLGVLAGAVFGVYLLFNYVVLPAYTRHDTALSVPDVVRMPFDDAVRVLQERDLEVEHMVQRFNPSLPRDVVVDQNPMPNALVKPGRTIYLTVNSGRQQMVVVPSLKDLSLREAENRLMALGLGLQETLPDSIPHPHRNTVTRQDPPPGDSLAEGSRVTLWYSTGLGSAFATVPDVSNMTVDEAQQLLTENKLRFVVIGAEEEDEVPAEEQVVLRQSREPGTRVPEGFEIRLYVGEEEPIEPRPDAQ